MKIGIIREGKIPPDCRAALSPAQAAFIQRNFDAHILVAPSPIRCFSDAEYRQEGIEVTHDLSDCDVLLGIKEVPIPQLQVGKTYFFFSHTIKKQAHNRALLQAVLEKNITLVDYEVLTDEYGQRLVAFGKFAGMVGAHNGLLGYGLRTGAFSLPRMKDLSYYSEARRVYRKTLFPPIRAVVTGSGRVSTGAIEVLYDAGFKEVSVDDYLQKTFIQPVFTQILPQDYVERLDGQPFSKKDYYADPSVFRSTFHQFFGRTDLLINGIFYDRRAPRFFELSDMMRFDFKIPVIADITCDMMPNSSIPSTIIASDIDQPFYGFDPIQNAVATDPFAPNVVTMMTVDNLPNELPRDASVFFGEQFIVQVLPELLRGGDRAVVERAMIAQDGHLTPRFSYLADYLKTP
jgi:hypothetical protein